MWPRASAGVTGLSAIRNAQAKAWAYSGQQHMSTPHPTLSTPHSALFVLSQPRRGGLQVAALVQDLDASLGLLEARMAEARQLDAALVQGEGRLQCQLAVFEALDDGFELGESGLEVLDGFHSGRILD